MKCQDWKSGDQVWWNKTTWRRLEVLISGRRWRRLCVRSWPPLVLPTLPESCVSSVQWGELLRCCTNTPSSAGPSHAGTVRKEVYQTVNYRPSGSHYGEYGHKVNILQGQHFTWSMFYKVNILHDQCFTRSTFYKVKDPFNFRHTRNTVNILQGQHFTKSTFYSNNILQGQAPCKIYTFRHIGHLVLAPRIVQTSQ